MSGPIPSEPSTYDVLAAAARYQHERARDGRAERKDAFSSRVDAQRAADVEAHRAHEGQKAALWSKLFDAALALKNAIVKVAGSASPPEAPPPEAPPPEPEARTTWEKVEDGATIGKAFVLENIAGADRCHEGARQSLTKLAAVEARAAQSLGSEIKKELELASAIEDVLRALARNGGPT